MKICFYFIFLFIFYFNDNIACCFCNSLLFFNNGKPGKYDHIYLELRPKDVKEEFIKYKENNNNYNTKYSKYFKNIFDKVIAVNNKYYCYYYHKNMNNDNILIFFHGAASNIFYQYFINEYNGYSLKIIFYDKFDILLPEYPGFQINDGETNEKSFNDLIENLSIYLQNLDYKNIIIAGHSFGCHLALKLALKLNGNEKLKGIILACPFEDIKSAVKHVISSYTCNILSFLSCFISKKYSNEEIISKIKHRIGIMYIPQDKICNPEDAKDLFNKIAEEYRFKCQTENKDCISHGFIDFELMRQWSDEMIKLINS